MRRADRLFAIVQRLRRARVVTAGQLAEELEVSERTIYRDLRDLVANGTPVEGEPGVGYRMRPGYDLPPLMFEAEELEALMLGVRIVASLGDRRLARASRSLLSKVDAVLPPARRAVLAQTTLFAPAGGVSRNEVGERLATVRHAMNERRRVICDYEREDGARSRRTLRPLGAFYWGKVWTLAAWCELRDDFRNFRLDRMSEVIVDEEAFADEPGRTLRDYLQAVNQRSIDTLEI